MSEHPAQPSASPAPQAAFAAIYLPPFAGRPAASPGALVEIAQAFSPRYERHGDEGVVMDVAGLERLMMSTTHHPHEHRAPVPQAPAHPAWRVMGEELLQAIAARGIRGHVAIAATRVTAVVLARARPGLTVVPRGAD